MFTEPPFAPLPEGPGLCFYDRHNLGFDHGMFVPERPPDLTALKDSERRPGVDKSGVQLETAPTRIQLTHVCPRVPVHDVKLTAESAASYWSTCPRPTHRSASDLHLHTFTVRHVNKKGYCDNRVCACFLGFSVAYDCIRAGHVGSQTDCLLPSTHLLQIQNVSLHARVWSSVLLVQRGLGSSLEATVTRVWSKRATRGYHSDYDDRSRQWEDSKPSDSTKDNKEAAEVATVAEFEVVESRDRNHERAVTDNAVGVTQASTTCNSTMALATERDTLRQPKR